MIAQHGISAPHGLCYLHHHGHNTTVDPSHPKTYIILTQILSTEGPQNTRTIVHELTFLPGTPAESFATVKTPTLIMASDHTAPEILQWATELEEAILHSTGLVLPGEWHGVDDATLTETTQQYLSSPQP